LILNAIASMSFHPSFINNETVSKDPFEVNIVHQPESKELLEYLRIQLSQWRKEQGDTVPVYVGKNYIAPERSPDRG